MNVGAAIVIFVIVWWCVFFAVLPLGVRGRWESESDGVAGADPGAPADPGLKRKAKLATMIAAPIALAICAVIASGIVSFRE
jgi:predicted secreted protein